jgi:hypothetical protein
MSVIAFCLDVHCPIGEEKYIPNNSLVENRVGLGLGNQGQCWVLANNVVELIIVDVKGLGGERVFSNSGPDEKLERWWQSSCKPRFSIRVCRLDSYKNPIEWFRVRVFEEHVSK